MLFTTYLAHLTKLRRDFTEYNGYSVKRHGLLFSAEDVLAEMGLKNPKVYYVMRNRGNDAVAPRDEFFLPLKKLLKSKEYSIDDLWPSYKENYLFQLSLWAEAKEWIERVAEESLFQDVVLVCYEMNHLRCHRTLLAQEIIHRYPEVNYVGELR